MNVSSTYLSHNKDEDNNPKILDDKNHQASSQKFRQQTPEKSRGTFRPKRCGNNNKDEDNNPKILKIKIIKLRLRNLDNFIIMILKISLWT